MLASRPLEACDLLFMRALTSEQRAAKFASQDQKKEPGLRSRGNRKLTTEEQEALFEKLTTQGPAKRLESLRIIREAVRSSDATKADFEKKVYEQSAQEYISDKQYGNVVHVLGHLCTLDEVSSYWHQLYAIALANTKQFESAIQHCAGPQDERYIRSVLNMDVPVWKLLVSAEKDELCQTLMEQLRPEVEAYTARLAIAYTHPAKLKQ